MPESEICLRPRVVRFSPSESESEFESESEEAEETDSAEYPPLPRFSHVSQRQCRLRRPTKKEAINQFRMLNLQRVGGLSCPNYDVTCELYVEGTYSIHAHNVQ